MVINFLTEKYIFVLSPFLSECHLNTRARSRPSLNGVYNSFCLYYVLYTLGRGLPALKKLKVNKKCF